MAIKTINRTNKPHIDISGPNGNAFYLLGIAENLCKQLGKDPKPILEEMKAGDYGHLISVFDREFGHIIDLYK